MYKVALTDKMLEELTLIRQILKETDSKLFAYDCKSEDETIAATQNAHAVMTADPKFFSEKMINSLDNCKVVVVMSIGVDAMNIKALTKKGIMLVNVPDYCLDEVADHALTLLLTVHRKVFFADSLLREDLQYRPKKLRKIKGLKDTTVGIYGFGRIGRLSAARLFAFGCAVQFCDPFVDEDVVIGEATAKKVDFETLMKTSDDILIHAPATSDNYHIMDDKAFGIAQKQPYIINVGRGEIIDVESLSRAINSGKVSGAALDVHENYSSFSADDTIFTTKNIILTPHCAWYSERSLNNMARTVAQEINRVLTGQLPLSLVNKQELGL